MFMFVLIFPNTSKAAFWYIIIHFTFFGHNLLCIALNLFANLVLILTAFAAIFHLSQLSQENAKHGGMMEIFREIFLRAVIITGQTYSVGLLHQTDMPGDRYVPWQVSCHHQQILDTFTHEGIAQIAELSNPLSHSILFYFMLDDTGARRKVVRWAQLSVLGGNYHTIGLPTCFGEIYKKVIGFHSINTTISLVNY